MKSKESPPSFLVVLTILCGSFALLFVVLGSPVAGFGLGIVLWGVLAVPYAMIRTLVNLSRKPLQGKKNAVPISAREPSLADRIATARARYEAMVGNLDNAGMTDTELAFAKKKAKARFLKEIDGLMS